MDRKKRKGSSRRAMNSNHKYSTAEVGEMVTMDQGGTSVADLDEDGEHLDYLEVAWLLREKLNDFVEGGKGGSPGFELRSVLHLAASRKLVSVDSKKMSPTLWRSLPKELLMRVLARLPLPDITRLRSLSKEWNREMATVNSDINRVLHETSPVVVAGFLKRGGSRYSKSEFLVTICTQRSPYSYRLHPEYEGRWDDTGAVDGGLVCFVSTWRPSKDNPLCIVVVNLLTRVWRKLPPRQYVYFRPPEMMHIKVDPTSQCYRVVVVDKNLRGHPTVEIYESRSRRWVIVCPGSLGSIVGSIFGLSHSWGFSRDIGSFHSTASTLSMQRIGQWRGHTCAPLLKTFWRRTVTRCP